MDDNYPFTSFNFIVSINVENSNELGLVNPLCDSAFSECDGLEMTMEPKTVREGGNNTQLIHLVGQVNYGNLTLKRGMTKNLALWKWFKIAASSPTHRGLLAQTTIVMRDAAGKGQIKYELFDCLPIKLKAAPLNAKDGIVAVEEMQISYSYFDILNRSEAEQ
ncbi:MAG: phage tail protein [Methylococcaceae bacterium]|nr:phage tail protein [Methylococcaceae bacterium]